MSQARVGNVTDHESERLVASRSMPEIPPEQELGHRLLDGYFAALTELDPQTIASLFAESGELEDPFGTPIRRGRAAIEEYWASGLCRVANRVEIETIAVLPSGCAVAAHWRMTAHADGGRQAQAEGIDVLRFDEDGLILRAEGYWDLQAFRRALAS
jgi:steroid Delta-isomerase